MEHVIYAININLFGGNISDINTWRLLEIGLEVNADGS
jgi:hypothetical protein